MKKIFQVFRRDSGIASSVGELLSGGTAKLSPEKPDHAAPIIKAASQTLSDNIQAILLDVQKLSGEDLSGFLLLIELLSGEIDSISAAVEEELPSALQGAATAENVIDRLMCNRGRGCARTLFQLRKHKSFVENCAQVGIASSLMNAMRLLRMYEIKSSKQPSSVFAVDSKQRSPTFSASQTTSEILRMLCVDSAIVEQLKPILVKTFTYPLSSLPLSGLHLQSHCALIVSAICRHGLIDSHVWFLHDVQAIAHILSHLADLVGYVSVNKSPVTPINETMLQKEAAEAQGMWVAAIDCVVDLLTSACRVSSNTILLSDFESADGPNLFLYMLKNSAPDRCMVIMSTISRLLFDESKEVEAPICHKNMGAMFSMLLVEYMGLERPSQREYGIDEMITLTNDILGRRAASLPREYLLQNLIFTLLTLYSNNSANCTILEETYNFLPTMILAFPSVSSEDISLSILKVLNYVCQCVDAIAPPALAALCSVAVVLLDCSLAEDDSQSRKEANKKFFIVCSTFETIIRERSQNAYILFHYGMLKYLFSDPLESLERELAEGAVMNKNAKAIYDKIIDLLIVIIQCCPSITVEIKRGNMIQLIRTLISSRAVGAEVAASLLRIPERLIYCDLHVSSIFERMPLNSSNKPY